MKYKILVVDDDKELVKMLCSYFNMKQYETITATDGMEALNKIKMKPDIILLDINMPRMDGIEVCRLIRSKVLCPILFLTARVMVRFPGRFFETHAAKTSNINQIMLVISSVILVCISVTIWKRRRVH